MTTRTHQRTGAPTAARVTACGRGRAAGEAGTAHTLMVVLLFPLTAVMLFAGVQTVLWQHARTIAADRANQIVAEVAAGTITPAEAETALADALTGERDLRPVTIAIDRTPLLSTVAVTAVVPGIMLGTRTRISVHASAPTEGWQPLP